MQIILTAVDFIYNWGRSNSLWPLTFATSCCGIEMISASAATFDISRFGSEVFRATPRQADLMITAGTVTHRMAPALVRLYEQMPEPKYVISMGACACGGGPFKEGYNVVSGIDKFIPVDVYISGCPPTPQALINGLMTLQKKIEKESLVSTRYYQKEAIEAIPIPVLGPDLIDVRKNDEIKTYCDALLQNENSMEKGEEAA